MDKLGVWHHLNGCEKSDFLFPVHGMSDKFRGRFMALLTRRLKEDGFVIANYIRKQCFDKDWVVYSRPPAKGVNLVLEYIARYAYRVAITNSRILDVTDNSISYDYKDYRKGGKHGAMTLYFVSFVAYFEIVTSLFVYNVKRYKSVFSSASCHLPFGNHTKTDIFPHNILITFAADVQRSMLHCIFKFYYYLCTR